MGIREKIENMKVEKVLGYTALFVLLLMIIWIKVLGATDVGIDVEKNGYCKQYGEDYKKTKGTDLCSSTISNKPNYEFTDGEFRSYCPKKKFLSLGFNSDCFKASGSIS